MPQTSSYKITNYLKLSIIIYHLSNRIQTVIPILLDY